MFRKSFGALVLLLAACRPADGTRSQLRLQEDIALGQAVRDSTLVEMKMYKVIGDRSPALAELPSTFPVALFSQKKTTADGTSSFETLGFAINCKGRDPGAVVRAFGDSFLDTGDAETVTEEDLNALFHLSDQPIFRCDALNGQNANAPQFSQVYRVLDPKTQSAYHVVRFNTYSPLDKRLYELGCSNILTNFLAKDQPVIPILRESLADVPGADNIGALHCFQTAAALPQNLLLPYQEEPLPLADAQLYRVQDPERGLLRVVISDGRAYRINCSSLDGDLQKAWNMPFTGTLPTVTAGDAAFDAYVAGQIDEQPSLDCPSVSRPEFASDAYQPMNQEGKSEPWLRLKSRPGTLVQFGCENATKFLVRNTPATHAITAESSRFIVRNYTPGATETKRYRIGCGPEEQPKARDIQLAFIEVFGVPAHEDWIKEHAAILKTRQKTFRYRDIVDYFVSTKANTPYEADLIAGRAFQSAYGRAASASDKAVLVDRMLNKKDLRPTYIEVTLDILGQGCRGCVRDALNPHIKDIEIAFTKVFGVPMSSSWAQSLLAPIKAGLSRYQVGDIEEYFVKGQADSEYEVGNITVRAFRAAKFRDANDDEKAFFLDYIFKQKRLRPHAFELMAYLESIEDLPRDQLTQSYMEVMNHASPEGLRWWTGEMFSHPGQVYSYAYAIDAHIAYLLRDEGADTLRWVVEMALDKALNRGHKAAWVDQVIRWIKNDHVVRAHYKELVPYIARRGQEFK